MASPTGEMTFWDHLDALRGVLLRVAAVMFVAAVGAFIAMPWVFDRFIMGPCSPDFPLYALLLSGESRWSVLNLRRSFLSTCRPHAGWLLLSHSL